MKQLGSIFNKIFSFGANTVSNARMDTYREWDLQRSKALSPSDRDEIDAIFSRAL